jgi:hypothetical protein
MNHKDPELAEFLHIFGSVLVESRMDKSLRHVCSSQGKQ